MQVLEPGCIGHFDVGLQFRQEQQRTLGNLGVSVRLSNEADVPPRFYFAVRDWVVAVEVKQGVACPRIRRSPLMLTDASA
jgi:hypothetical protein